MADVEKFTYYDSGRTKVIKPTDRMVIGSGGLAFEGSTNNDFETAFTVTDPTADRSIEIPDEDGEIALLQGSALPKALSFPVKNPSNTTALTKGQIVYISGHSGNKPEVSLAQSNSTSTMPAFGFVQADIAAEAEGFVVYSGLFKGIDTNTSYAEGDTLYVSATSAGDFQNTAPAGNNLIQNIGKIVKSHTSNGELLVGGAGRTNATPNLNEGHIFIGNTSDQSVQSVYTLPTSDGTENQILQTDGSGTLSFADNTGLSNIVEDETPQLGGTLDLNSHPIQGNLLPSIANTYSLGSSTLEWSDLYLGDSSVVYFGNDQDVMLTHAADTGLTLKMGSSQLSYDPIFTIQSSTSNTNGIGPQIKIQKMYTDAGDIVGDIYFQGFLSPSYDNYARIRARAPAQTHGNLQLLTLSGNTESIGINIVGDSSSQTPKVKISEAYYLPTSDGTENQILQTDGSGNLSFADVSGGISNVVEDETPQLGGNLDPNGFGISNNILPSIANTYSLGSSALEWSDLYLGDSSVVYFGNDQDVKLTHNHNSGLTIEMTNDALGDPTLELKSAYSGNYGGPFIKLNLDSSSPAVNDVIGGIQFYGDDSGGSSREFGKIVCQAADISGSANHASRITIGVQNGNMLGSSPVGLQVEGVSGSSSKVKVNVYPHNGTDSGLHLNGTLVTSTAAEINLLDGGTSVGSSINVEDADGIIINDAGIMKTIPASDLKAYVGTVAADDLETGGAAVTIATSVGNITLDAQGNDTDIIFKGTDGGIDTTFLTLDGSAAGAATFNSGVTSGGALLPSAANTHALGSTSSEWSDLYLGDFSVIYFGSDQDTKLTHVHDSGLKFELDSAGSNEPKFEFISNNAGNLGPSLSMFHDSSSPAVNDVFSTIEFKTNNDADQAHVICKIQAIASNVTDASESSEFRFINSNNGGSFTSGNVVFTSDGIVKSRGGFGTLVDNLSLKFGIDEEITLTHVHNSGVNFKNESTSSGTNFNLTLQSNSTSVSAGNVISSLNFQAPNESSGSDAVLVCAGIEAVAESSFTSTNNSTKLSFKTSSSESASEKMSLSSEGKLSVHGVTALKIQASDPSIETDFAHIYAKDVASSAELFVQDEAGNVTQISPHNEEGDWIYWSENIKTGKKVKVNMEKMIKRLEVITGETFFEEYTKER